MAKQKTERHLATTFTQTRDLASMAAKNANCGGGLWSHNDLAGVGESALELAIPMLAEIRAARDAMQEAAQWLRAVAETAKSLANGDEGPDRGDWRWMAEECRKYAKSLNSRTVPSKVGISSTTSSGTVSE